MGKDSPFIGINNKPEFKYSFEIFECFGKIKILEKEIGNNVSTVKILQFFAIDKAKIKLTKLSLIDDKNLNVCDDLVDKYKYARNLYLNYINLTFDECLEEAVKLKNNNKNILKICAVFDAMENIGKTSFKIPERLFKYLFYKNKYPFSKFLEMFNTFNISADKLPLHYYFNDIKIVSSLCLDNFARLRECGAEFSYSLFLDNFEYILELLLSFDIDAFEKFSAELDKMKLLLTEDNLLEVFCLRNAIYSKKKCTLEEIGRKNGYTRERVRQIEKKCYFIIDKKCNLLKSSIRNILIKFVVNNTFVSGSISNRFKNLEEYRYFIVLVRYFEDIGYIYDESIDAFFNSNNIKGLFETYESESAVFFSTEQFNKFELPKKYYVLNYYNLKEGKIYIHKGFSLSDVILDIFDSLYPQGSGFSTAICNQIKKHIFDNYKLSLDFESRNLLQYLSRHNYCTIDNGTYINRKYAATISNDLKEQIVSYILGKNSIVTYRELFEVFKSKLEPFNIRNWFYLKGVIDQLLPDGIITRKSCCSKINVNCSMEQKYDDLFIKHNGLISFNDFIKENPGSKEFHLTNYIIEKNNIVCLSNKRYVDLDIYKIKKSDIEYLKKEIETEFKTLNTKYFKIGKLYSKMKILDSYFLNTYCFIKTENDLIRLCKKILPEYFYGWNVISKNREISTSYGMIYAHFSELKSFSMDELKKYCASMHIHIFNMQELLENLSEFCVQVSQSNFVNKIKFKNCDLIINKIYDLINFYIVNYSQLNTSEFNGYVSFPNLYYQWNQYFLVGIIRAYFKNKFTIEVLYNGKNVNYYIIRRIEK